MIKLKKTVLELINQAKKEINYLTVEECIRLHPDENNSFIALRDIREITKSGRVLRDQNVSRGMLKLWINNSSLNYKEFFFNIKLNFIYYCASSLRSPLATRTSYEIELLNTSNILGEYIRC